MSALHSDPPSASLLSCSRCDPCNQRNTAKRYIPFSQTTSLLTKPLPLLNNHQIHLLQHLVTTISLVHHHCLSPLLRITAIMAPQKDDHPVFDTSKWGIGRKPDFTTIPLNDFLPTSILSLQTNVAITPSAVAYSDITPPGTTSMKTVTSLRPWQYPQDASSSSSPTPQFRPKRLSGAVIGAAGAISTLAMLLILAGICLLFCRRSRKKRLSQQRGDGEMAQLTRTTSNSTNFTEARPYITTQPPPSLTTSSSMLTPSSTGSHTMPEAPILLSTTINQSYYTGIDTSDDLSLAESGGPTIPAPAYAGSILEPPPPPYRPRSALTRDSSMRYSVAPPSYGPRLSVRSTNQEAVASPFDDPEDDDSPVSEVAPSPTGREAPQIRDMEEMSDVSELSYQQDPIPSRPTSTAPIY